MITRRAFASAIILILVITTLFMLPVLIENYSTQMYLKRISTEEDAASSEDSFSSNSDNESTSLLKSSRRMVYFLTDDSHEADLYSEWCEYRKLNCKAVICDQYTHEEFPHYLLVGSVEITQSVIDMLHDYLHHGVRVIFTVMPDYNVITGNHELQDILGISTCKNESIKIDSFFIFKDFLLSKERLYSDEDYFGDKNNFSMCVPYYELRTGYKVFAQGRTEELNYMDFPPILWRTYTDQSYVFAVNTDVITGKQLFGILTAFLSQCDSYDLYPIINVQSASVLNFPVMADENKVILEDTYGRDLYSLTRDILWPSISTILLSFGKSYNFFYAACLDYENSEAVENNDFVYYYSEILNKLGTLGVSYDQTSDIPLKDVNSIVTDTIELNIGDYTKRALYIPRDHLDEASDVLDLNSSIVMTDYSEDDKLIAIDNKGMLYSAFTSSGIIHNMETDLLLISLETALGLDLQGTNIIEALNSNDDTYWEAFSDQWASSRTYVNDFTVFDTVSIEEAANRIRDFLSLEYSSERTEDGIKLNLSSFSGEGQFILRLWNEVPVKIDGGTIQQISDTAYLINATSNCTIYTADNSKRN